MDQLAFPLVTAMSMFASSMLFAIVGGVSALVYALAKIVHKWALDRVSATATVRPTNSTLYPALTRWISLEFSRRNRDVSLLLEVSKKRKNVDGSATQNTKPCRHFRLCSSVEMMGLNNSFTSFTFARSSDADRFQDMFSAVGDDNSKNANGVGSKRAGRGNDGLFELPPDDQSLRVWKYGALIHVTIETPKDDPAERAEGVYGVLSSSRPSKQIVMRAFGSGAMEALRAFSRDALDEFQRAVSNKTQVFTLSSNDMSRYESWRSLAFRPKRPVSSVFLEDAQMIPEILADCRRFLDSGLWYAGQGIPHRRGFLFHGPPGAGKTSAVAAIAGELNLDICLLSLNAEGLSDNKLALAMAQVPKRAIVLLEDVDAAFPDRRAAPSSCDAPADGSGGAADQAQLLAQDVGFDGGRKRRASPASVTFSGLLNAIDGVAASEGVLLFMTTNHPERLDEALLRPGRIDKRVPFGPARKPQAERLFVHFFAERDVLVRSAPDTRSVHSLSVLQTLAAEFADGVPKDGELLSMAALQGHLLDHRDDPVQAVRQFRLRFPTPKE